MAEQAPREKHTQETEIGSTITRDVDEEFHTVIEKEFEMPPDSKDTYIKPFLMGRMVLKEIVVDNRHRAPQPSTNRSVTWTPKDDGSGNRVDAVTYGDND